ncbi:MAG: clostripain-related cysteine peptidase [Bacilli bacterium]|nr:clostripain-related cysteine peptidase [Bacilli bacterium]
MQFKASAGYIYNSSPINGITSITIDSGNKTWGGSVYYGNSSKPAANQASSTNGKYVIPAGNSYFNIIKDSQYAGYIKSITIEYSTTPPTPINPTGISIPSSTEIGVGSSKTLDVTFTPSGCNTNKGISWISSNSSIVSVSQGTITGVKAGTATITATSTYDTNLKSSCTVTVTQQKADTWTILMYVCGADLESESGLASGDFEEILSVRNQPDDVNIVIQTGGAKSWDSSYGYGINASYNQRYHVENRQLVCDNSKVYNTYTSMGVSTTLKDFITWGMQTYPAEKTGLVFWNHGGGMRGVCYDEKKSDDSLKNSEIKSAVSGAMTTLNRTEKLEFIGFDACLMQVQDIAEFMSPYFNYMVGSEESEAGYGWDYDNWVDDLYAKKDTTVILKAICDSFIADNGGVSSTRNDQTLSYLNLQYASEYKTAWENFASALSTKLGSTSANTFSSWVVSNVKHYADSDYNYFHLFDAKDFVNKVASNSSYNPGSTYTSAVLTAHSKLVGYSTCGKGAGNSYGLCCVYVCTQDRDYALINNYYTTSETNFTTWRTFCTKYGDLK